jgi:hypothetical protein
MNMADMEAKEISLKATVHELEKVTTELKEVHKTAVGKQKQELELQIQSLGKVREELVSLCHKTFPLWAPPKV